VFGMFHHLSGPPFRGGRLDPLRVSGTRGHRGKIHWRTTHIRTFDKRLLYVPNTVFIANAVENPSRMTHRRIYETIGVRYEDAGRVAEIVRKVKEMLKTHPEIDPTQTTIVNLNAFAPSSLDFFIYVFTRTTNWIKYHEVKQDVLLKVLEIIEECGAECAFPTSTVLLQGGEAAGGRWEINVNDYFSDRENGPRPRLKEINLLFARNNIAYKLKNDGKIYRVLSPQLDELIQNTTQTSSGDKTLDQMIT